VSGFAPPGDIQRVRNATGWRSRSTSTGRTSPGSARALGATTTPPSCPRARQPRARGAVRGGGSHDAGGHVRSRRAPGRRLQPKRHRRVPRLLRRDHGDRGRRGRRRHGRRYAMRAAYSELFRATPNLHAEIATRIRVGDYIIDEERVTGRRGLNGDVRVVVIYHVGNKPDRPRPAHPLTGGSPMTVLLSDNTRLVPNGTSVLAAHAPPLPQSRPAELLTSRPPRSDWVSGQDRVRGTGRG
jgi:hypothetical protein